MLNLRRGGAIALFLSLSSTGAMAEPDKGVVDLRATS
jgi:hypothetical protein